MERPEFTLAIEEEMTLRLRLGRFFYGKEVKMTI